METRIPDYPNSRDAIIEALLYYKDLNWSTFWELLCDVTSCSGNFDPHIERECKAMLTATAEQYCEAFLATIGEWEYDE